MSTQNLYISITEGHRQLVIDGPIDLFQKLLETVTKPEIFNPRPDLINTPPAGALS